MAITATMEAREVVAMRMPALSMVNTGTKSKETGVLILETVLFGIWSYLGGEWTLQQARECAEMMFSEYHWMSMPELKLFALRCKQGKFACLKNYAKFTTRMMGLCFEEYEGELLILRAGQRHLDKPKAKEAQLIEGPEFDAEPYIEQMIQQIGMRGDLNKVQREHENITPEEFARQNGIDLQQFKKDK